MSRLSATLFLHLVLACGSAVTAFAHASPTLYEPAASAVLDKTPQRVRIRFTEQIEPEASSIRIFGPDGRRADANDGKPDPGDARAFGIDVRDAGPGSYTVSWQVVSADDGHFTKGGFSFTVGRSTDVAATQTHSPVEISFSSATPQAAAIAVELVGHAIWIGLLAATALLWRPMSARRATAGHQPAFEHAFSRMAIVGAAFAIAGIGFFLILKTRDLQQDRATSFSDTLGTFAGTVDGRFALYRAALALAFLVMLLIAKKTIVRSKRFVTAELILWALMALIMLARARVSHAAASHLMPNFSIVINALHLLSKEFWIGILIATTFLFFPLLIRLGRTSVAAELLSLVSKYIDAALGLTAITGAYIVWLHLKSPSHVFTTEWGVRFVVLGAFAAALIVFRLYNQIVVERYLAADCISPQTGLRRDAAASWRYSIPMEMCIGVALLSVTSQLIITTPPYPADQFVFHKEASSQGAEISLSVHPVDAKQFLVAVSDEKSGTPSRVDEAVITLQNMGNNIGPVVAETEHRFEGGFTFRRDALSTPGQWDIDITARRQDSYDAVAHFQLDYPNDIDQSRVGGDERHFGIFEFVLISAALASLLLAYVLFRFSAGVHTKVATIDSRRGLTRAGFSFVKSLAGGIAATLAVSLVIWASYDTLVKSDFQRLCESNNGVWHQSVPMRSGAIVSSETMTGCTAGPDHFVDSREYSYFLNLPPQPVEHHHH